MLRNALSRVAEVVTELRKLRGEGVQILGSPDGRWMLVSTTITASVAIAVTWLSLNAAPASSARAYEPRPVQAVLPYDLLLRLTGLSAVPAIAAEDSNRFRSAGLMGSDLVGPLDRMLAAERASSRPPVDVRTLRVDSGETIMGMLQEAGVSNTDAAAVVDAILPYYSPKNIRSGQTFRATFGAAAVNPEASGGVESAPRATEEDDLSPVRRLLSLSFAPSIDQEITVSLTAPDGYLAHNVHRPLEAHYQHAGGRIDSSLYLTAIQAGIPANVVGELIRMFLGPVDFQRDLHEGDEFSVVFNRYFTADGTPAKAGDILSASLTLSGKRLLLYRFETPDGGVEYFDQNGQSSKAMLMKTPVDGARISSGFGARRHPILGYTRMHKGVDFAVPSGTPVMAAGNGTVVFAGRGGDYGNLVIINHGNNYATAYGHLSRFATGVHSGARVSQGDVVAYSGMTGLATGPHLHYEIRLKNGQVNPATVKIASGRKLEGSMMAAFTAERGRIDRLVASLPLERKLAQAPILRESRDQ